MPQRYLKLNDWLKSTFGERVYKVGLHGGFSCPNRDGTLGTGGCTFCNPAGSAPWDFDSKATLQEQWERGVRHLGARHGVRRFIAYFQDYTTTFDEADRLEDLWREALALPGCIGLALCTRPDCLGDEVLDRLQDLASETFLWVEVGVQTIHDRTLQALNRCHSQTASEAALAALSARGICTVGHVVLGLPGETKNDMLETARFLARAGIWGAKIHNLHVVQDTHLADAYHAGHFIPMSREDYVDYAIGFLEQLPPDVVIHRLCAAAQPGLTVAPRWACNKMQVVNAIDREMARRDTGQGGARND